MVSVETAPSGTGTAMPLPATAITAGFNSATVVLTKTEDIYHSLHPLMGGSAAPLKQPGDPTQHSILHTWHITNKTEYVCMYGENWTPNQWDGDILDNPCNTCDLMKSPQTPRVQELLKQAMDRDKAHATA